MQIIRNFDSCIVIHLIAKCQSEVKKYLNQEIHIIGGADRGLVKLFLTQNAEKEAKFDNVKIIWNNTASAQYKN